MFKTIEVSIDGSLGYLTLNRPNKLNALSTQALQELTQAASWFDTHQEVKVVIVAGRGRAFCAGADFESFSGALADSPRSAADAGRIMADALEAMRAVTIAKIQGWCVGGGLVLAAACDLRIASSEVRFSIPEVDLGIPLAWGGIPRLVREIGPAFTKELVMTCREFNADEAKQAGFLNQVVTEQTLDEKTYDLAAQILAKPAMPIASTKRHVNSVTRQMVGLESSWSDADGLLSGLDDEECQSSRAKYLQSKNTA